MYTVYCYNQSEAVKRVDQVKRENPKFNKFLDEKVNDPECRSLDLNSFLITPIQRICRYPLLLKELLKYTPKDHVDHAGLSNAIKKVEEVVARLNEERRIIENQIKLAKLDEKIVFEKKQDFDIIDPKRRFVSQGAFDLISSVSDSKSGVVKTKGNSRRIFFLFSDFLLIAKEELDKFMVKQQIPLGTCLVWIIEETDPKLIDPKHDGLLFGVCRTDKKDKMTFAASTRKERDEWVELIQLQAESVDKTDIKKLKNKSLHLSGSKSKKDRIEK
jgi:hypothetical protein